MLLLLLHLVKPSAVFSRERNWECTGETRERDTVLATAVSSEALESVLSFSSSLWGGVFP